MPQASSTTRTRSIAFVGLSVALMAVSAWVTVALGPVPFTLQIFAVVLVLLALEPAEALASIACYLLMGAVGLPVFSAMRGGMGVLLGPTGGFLWGYLVGAAAALAFLQVASRNRLERPLVVDAAAAVIFLVLAYLCGWLQLMPAAGLSPQAAFASGIAPFIALDALKIAVAVPVARAVRKAVGPLRV